tara:strand:+ start:651 stop:884 length:234 start_codon:yes stop_codon:yes gene_type:complete
MINTEEQLNKVINEQLKEVYSQLDKVPEGEQKEYLKSAVNELKNNRKLDPMDFVNNFAKLKGVTVDIDKLKDIINKA